MVKVVVLHESKYGKTELVAEKISEVGRIGAVLSEVKEVNLDELADCDAILMGSPNHIGRPTRSIQKFIDRNTKPKTYAKPSDFDSEVFLHNIESNVGDRPCYVRHL